ncbi:hypothetical protein PWT90_09851 [Aphanocladium album]|nr:hypothetical protein PWT90_09851 [Aphanocladium album]
MVGATLSRRTRGQVNAPTSTNRPAPPRQHRRPKDTERRVRTAAPLSEAKTTIGVDFGSSHWGVAASSRGADPQSIPLGEAFSNDGSRTPAKALPTYTRFGGAEGFKVLGHDEVLDFTNVSSGLKQSLDDELCRDENEGQKFRDLCKAYNVTPQEVLKAQLKVVLKFITAELSERGISQLDGCKVNFAVPVIWTRDKRGGDIQNQIRSCAIEAGFPVDIDFDVESFMAERCFGGQEPFQTSPQGKSVQNEYLSIDPGSATVEFLCWAPIGDGGAVRLTREPDGCAGGMSYFWPWLFNMCGERGINYIAARRHVFHLRDDDDSEDMNVGGKTIQVADIKERIAQCFADAIKMAQEILGSMPHLRTVHISGGAPCSNRFIEALWTGALRESRGNRALDVRFLPADHATDAVALAAAIPYSDDPLPRFTAGCFGFLCTNSKVGGFIQQVKPPNSNTVSEEWESAHVDGVTLVVEPCMIPNGKLLPQKSVDTFHAAWREGFEVTMDPVVFDLTGHVPPEPHEREVKVRFTREKEDLKNFALEVDCGNGTVKKKTLELCGDRERIYFVVRSPHQEDSSAALDSQPSSLSYEGQIESQLEETTQGRDAQPPAPEQANQAAGEQHPGRLSASVGPDQGPAESANQQQTTEPDDSAGPDGASVEQSPGRDTPPIPPSGDVYDVPTTPPQSRGSKRKRNAPHTFGSASSRRRRRISASDTDNVRQKNPGRSEFLDKVLL